ncbi:MAG: hypothetical protein ACE5GS_05850 [Kiloniellaceae bacterium]
MTASTALLVFKLLDLLALGVQVAPPVLRRYKAARARIDLMIAEGRDPTPEEVREIDNGLAALQAELHGRPG